MRTHLARPAGVLAAAILSAVLLAACDTGAGTGPADASSAAPTSAASTAAPATSTAPTRPAGEDLLGPTGYGALRLGMTPAQAAATKLITTPAGEKTGCWTYAHLIGSGKTDQHDIDGRLFFSEKLGLAAIYAYPGVETPEGITVGSTVDEVRRAYPSWEAVGGEAEGRGYVKVPGNDAAAYRIEVDKGKVIQLSLQLGNQDCYE